MEKKTGPRNIGAEGMGSTGGIQEPKKVWLSGVQKAFEQGYTVYPVNPNLTELDGKQVYPSLKELPEVPKVVSFVVPPEVTRKAVEQAKELGVRYLWMQPGAEDADAVKLAEKAGMVVIYNQCILQLA